MTDLKKKVGSSGLKSIVKISQNFLFRNDQCMAFHDRECIEDSDVVFVFGYFVRRNLPAYDLGKYGSHGVFGVLYGSTNG